MWDAMKSFQVVTPAGILARHLHNQRLHFAVNPRLAGACTIRTIELLRYQFPEPAEDRLGFEGQGDFRQSLPPQPSCRFRRAWRVAHSRAAAELAHVPGVSGSPRQ